MNFLSFNNNSYIFNDIIFEICNHINDKDKIMFLSVCKHCHMLKNNLLYYNVVLIDNISRLWYFNRFTEIIIIFDIGKIPDQVRKIYYGNFVDGHINVKIPIPWKSIKSYGSFDDFINKKFPSSLTHLFFGTWFNTKISTPIPNTITHIIFCTSYDQPIDKDILPNSLTHIIFGKHFDQTIDNLPKSIITLGLPGKHFNKSIPLLPNLEYLNLNILYLHEIENTKYPNLKMIEWTR